MKKKRKLTQKQMYDYLYRGAYDFKKANARKSTTEDTIVRQSNIYACRNTVKCWKAQWRNK